MFEDSDSSYSTGPWWSSGRSVGLSNAWSRVRFPHTVIFFSLFSFFYFYFFVSRIRDSGLLRVKVGTSHNSCLSILWLMDSWSFIVMIPILGHMSYHSSFTNASGANYTVLLWVWSLWSWLGIWVESSHAQIVTSWGCSFHVIRVTLYIIIRHHVYILDTWYAIIRACYR